MNKFLASVLVLLGAASYGMLSTITKLAYKDGFTTANVVGSQIFFGCIVFWFVCLPQWKKLFQLPLKTIGLLVLSGSVSGLTGIFYYLSLKTLSASFAVILLFQFTWMGIMFEWVFSKRKPTIYQWLAVILILLGTYLASGCETFSAIESINPMGLILGLLAACSYTLFINFSGHTAAEVPTLIRNAWMVLGALLLTFIVYPPMFLLDGSLSRGLWFWGGFLGIFGIIVPFYLFAKGVPSIGTGMSSLLGAVELPVVIIFSSYLLKEQTGFLQWIGIVVILLGIAVSAVKKNKDK